MDLQAYESFKILDKKHKFWKLFVCPQIVNFPNNNDFEIQIMGGTFFRLAQSPLLS